MPRALALALAVSACGSSQRPFPDDCFTQPAASCRPMLESACRQGTAAACSSLYAMLAATPGAPPGAVHDAWSGYVGIRVRSCAAGSDDASSAACDEVGDWYAHGQYVASTPSPGRAAARYARACGTSKTCPKLDALVADGLAASDGTAAAVACAAGRDHACAQACDAGLALGCANACDQGNATACELLGNQLWSGKGASADRARAAAFYQKGCDAGRASACAQLAAAFEQGNAGGRGVPKDPTLARRYYGKACAAGDQASCNRKRVLDQQDAAARLQDAQQTAATDRMQCCTYHPGGVPQGLNCYQTMLRVGGNGCRRNEKLTRVTITDQCRKDDGTVYSYPEDVWRCVAGDPLDDDATTLRDQQLRDQLQTYEQQQEPAPADPGKLDGCDLARQRQEAFCKASGGCSWQVVC